MRSIVAAPLGTIALVAALLSAALSPARASQDPPAANDQPDRLYRLPGAQPPAGAPVPRGLAPLLPVPRADQQAPGANQPPTEEKSVAKPAEPLPDMELPEGRQKILDDLFSRLRQSQDHDESRFLVAAIQRVWMHSGSDTADLLMSRATQTMQAQGWSMATDLLDKIVEISPNWAEGWNKRATARYLADDFSGAVEDIAHTLALEPRHFGALRGLGDILQRLEMYKLALRAYRAALELNPNQDNLRKMIDKLALDVEGHNI